MLNEITFLQIFLLINLWFLTKALNLLIIWYLAGIFLLVSGCISLCYNGDIFIGFLWVIDLGVGLIFFIFILHFSNFLHQKININLPIKQKLYLLCFVIFIFLFFYFIHFLLEFNLNLLIKKLWFFYITWYNYYILFNSYFVAGLNILREIYFYNNGFEFFVINFMLFYGIIATIILCYLTKSFFINIQYNQTNNFSIFSNIYNSLFIRNQNFLKQQNTSTGSRIWKKTTKLNDF